MKYLQSVLCSLIILSAVLIVGSGCNFKKESEKHELTKVRIPVVVDTVRYRTLVRTREFTAVLEPYKQADLAPLTQGTRVKRIYVDVGDYVRKGQVLARMDDAMLVSTHVRFETLASQYERQKQLFEKNAISKAQFESIESEYKATKRQLEQIRENTTITAPFNGVVTDVAVEEGEVYSPTLAQMGGTSGLIQLTQLNLLKVDLDVDEDVVSKIEKGMKVKVRVDALGDTAVAGTVQWVNPSAARRSHTFGVRIIVPNKGLTLKAGYFVSLAIITDTRENVLAVPVTALVGKQVFIVENDMALAREVETGWETDAFVEIESGVSQHALVITGGNKALPDSAGVIVQREKR
jgi:membrane fusion protein (multidrug efflux system)